MKKTLLSMLVLAAACLMPANVWAAQVTLKLVYNGSTVVTSNSASVSIYKNGEQLNSSYGGSSFYNGECSVSIDDSYAGQKVSYRTSLGHEGTFTVTDGATVNLECKKLTVTTKDSDGAALTGEYVKISCPNGQNTTFNTSYDTGEAVVYFAKASGYSYEWNSVSGNFDLTADYALNLKRGKSGESGEQSTKYTLRVVCRYGDFPVGNSGSMYLCKYGDTNGDYFSSYNSSVSVYAGSYWIKDDIGAFSKKIEVTGDMTAYLDYQKVTFKSMTGSTPNAGQTIDVRVYSENNTGYYGSSKTVTTNAKGEASMYLLPGEYQYTVAGGTQKFTVEEADKTVDIKTGKVTITLNCDDKTALGTQTFEFGSNNNGYSSIQPVDGKIVVNAMPGNYRLRINQVSAVDVTVTEGETALPVQLYSVMFTTNLSTAGSMYVGGLQGNSKQVGYNTKYYFTAGEYSYGSVSYTSGQVAFTLDGNKTIALNYAKLTVTVKDTDGKAVESMSVYCSGSGNSVNTDMNGQAFFTLLQGTYDVYASEFSDDAETVELKGDASVTLTVPAYVTFNMLVNGQPATLNDTRSLYENSDRVNPRYMRYVSPGVMAARIVPGKAYYLSNNQGSAVITEGGTLSLGTLSISNEGMGLAFPMENWEAVSTYNVVVGSTVRLTAIPVSDDKFQHWTINGTDYSTPMIDLKLKEVHTDAKAVFSGAVTSTGNVKMMNTLAFSIDDSYIYLSDDTEGVARIYSSEGKLLKNIGVVGGQIGIYDLPAGVYILTFQGENGAKSTRFVKQ